MCGACMCGCVIGLFFPHSYDQYAYPCVCVQYAFSYDRLVYACVYGRTFLLDEFFVFSFEIVLPQSSSPHHTTPQLLYSMCDMAICSFVANVAFFRFYYYCCFCSPLRFLFGVCVCSELLTNCHSRIALVLECAQPISLIIHALNGGPKDSHRHRYSFEINQLFSVVSLLQTGSSVFFILPTLTRIQYWKFRFLSIPLALAALIDKIFHTNLFFSFT